MPAMPDISICIANYNGADFIVECLESVYSQTGNFSCEVLLHDDCSTDSSLQIVRTRYPEVVLIESKTNVGFCISNNRMVERSTGRYILLLNNDATLRPGSLHQFLDFARAGHEGDVLGLPQYVRDGREAPMDRGYRIDPFMNPIPVTAPGTHGVAVATGACLWVPKSTWDRVGGFPPWFESVAEDIYLCTAARLLGHEVIVLGGSGFDHWVGKNLGGGKIVDDKMRTTVRRRSLSERNKTFVMLLCYPWVLLLLILPLHVAFLVFEAVALTCMGTGWAKVRKIYAGIPASIWTKRQDWLRLRRQLMTRRKCSVMRLLVHTQWLPHKLRMLMRHGRPHVR